MKQDRRAWIKALALAVFPTALCADDRKRTCFQCGLKPARPITISDGSVDFRIYLCLEHMRYFCVVLLNELGFDVPSVLNLMKKFSQKRPVEMSRKQPQPEP